MYKNIAYPNAYTASLLAYYNRLNANGFSVIEYPVSEFL